jgi:hypothetical protein
VSRFSAPTHREVEVVQPDGARALMIGKLDAIPEGAGGLALRIRVCDAHVQVLTAEPRP